MKESWIGLLDCNNFFVSCERLFRPDLKNVPVAVLSSNDGCIVARSQEIKDKGIPMGVPYFQIKDILKTSNARIFSGNHRLYRDISKRVFSLLLQIIPNAEQYSVDEAFFTIEGSEAKVMDEIVKLKDTIEAQVGIPVSIGVSRTKTLAKVANGIAKKSGGLSVLPMAEWDTIAKTYPLEQIWGIGAGFSARLRQHDLQVASDFRAADTARIRRLFGVVGERMQQELNGQKALISSHKPKQSIMSSRSFSKETDDLQVLKDAVAYHVEEIAYELRQMHHKTRVLAVYIAPSRHGDFVLQNRSREQMFEIAENTTRGLTKAAFALLEDMYEADVPYKKAGVRVTQLESVLVSQLSLFTTATNADADPLQTAIDHIHGKYQSGRLHLGRLEGAAVYQGKSDQKSPGYTTNWNELKAVKAS